MIRIRKWMALAMQRRVRAKIMRARNTQGTNSSELRTHAKKTGLVSYVDITDLLCFLAHDHGVTGIPRVQLELIAALLNVNRQQSVSSRMEILFCCRPDRGNSVFTLEHDILVNLCRTRNHPNPQQGSTNRILLSLFQSKALVSVNKGDIYLVLGAFWNSLPYDRFLKHVSSSGVRTGALIYDILPYTHPQYFLPDLANSFRRSLESMLANASFLLTISSHVAGEVNKVCMQRGSNNIWVKPLPLAHTLTVAAATKFYKGNDHSGLGEIVLSVSTIEIRKNHHRLVEVWKRLYRKFGEQLPKLVIVGRWGWDVEELRESLNSSNYVNQKVVIFNSVTDTELAQLYDKCLFTTFVSLAEGWGLPIGESLSSGKTCVCSSTTSMPEVGGQFCEYVDPSDENDMFECFYKLLSSRNKIDELNQNIRLNFFPRGWDEVAVDFENAVAAIPSD